MRDAKRSAGRQWRRWRRRLTSNAATGAATGAGCGAAAAATRLGPGAAATGARDVRRGNGTDIRAQCQSHCSSARDASQGRAVDGGTTTRAAINAFLASKIPAAPGIGSSTMVIVNCSALSVDSSPEPAPGQGRWSKNRRGDICGDDMTLTGGMLASGRSLPLPAPTPTWKRCCGPISH